MFTLILSVEMGRLSLSASLLLLWSEVLIQRGMMKTQSVPWSCGAAASSAVPWVWTAMIWRVAWADHRMLHWLERRLWLVQAGRECPPGLLTSAWRQILRSQGCEPAGRAQHTAPWSLPRTSEMLAAWTGDWGAGLVWRGAWGGAGELWMVSVVTAWLGCQEPGPAVSGAAPPVVSATSASSPWSPWEWERGAWWLETPGHSAGSLWQLINMMQLLTVSTEKLKSIVLRSGA